MAAVLALSFVLVLGWFLFVAEGPRDAAGDGDFGEVPSVLDILGDVESGGGLNLKFTDEDDPTRVAATLEADSIRPARSDGAVEPSVYELEAVRAKFFLDSGDTVLIESERGRFFMPDRQAGPESGSLVGSPTITLLDNETGEAELIARMTEVLRFNFNYSHIETPGRLHVLGRGIEFQGNHVTARLNQQSERIDVLEVEQGEFIKYDPTVARADEDEARARSGRPVEPGNDERDARAEAVGREAGSSITRVHFTRQDAPPPPTEPPHVAHYLATFSDSVELRQGAKRVTADQLESWVRLIDHKIPDRTGGGDPGASAESAARRGDDARVETGPADSTPSAPRPPRDIPVDDPEPADRESVEAPSAAPASGAPVLGVGSSDELVELTWTGKLRVVPLVESEPEPLARDHAAFRFTATETGLVRFEDTGSSGHAAVAEYAATREMLTLTGPGGSVLLEAIDKGWIEASKTVVRLASGDVTVVGPGQVNDGARGGAAGQAQRHVNWIDQADFAFLMADHKMTGDIERASFAGRARAVDGERRVDGEMLVARFIDDRHGGRVIGRVEADEMSATDGLGATMSGRRIDIPFRVVEPGKSEPAEVFASGDVDVVQDDKHITAEVLTAVLAEDADGKLTVTDVIADRGARYTEGERIDATAERIEADGLDEIAVLIGTDAEPARITHDNSLIVGPRITMAQDPQRGSVAGPGRFEQTRDDGRIEASWADGMTFDRTFGVLECIGAARVDQTLADGEVRTATGDSLTVEFADRGGEMVFDAASIFGAGGSPAVVETRRAADTGDEPITMMNLRSTEILATGGGSGLIVPAPGRLVILDRRPGGAEGNLDGWDRGHAMFTWTDTMVVDRLLGTARLSGDAQAVHRTHGDGRTAELAADAILTTFLETEGEGAEITRLDAEGTAYFRMEDREVLASTLRFDTVARVVYALASPETPIRFIDSATGAVLSARSLEWDLETDRIEIDGPSPLAVPRGGG